MIDHNQNFLCLNCSKTVAASGLIGTKNRNHCPYCLYSKHVDDKIAGDRLASCHNQMKPIGLTLKDEGVDKYGKPRQGELMIIHKCEGCGKISINRIAADDDAKLLLSLLDTTELDHAKRQELESDGVKPLRKSDSGQLKILLFGKFA